MCGFRIIVCVCVCGGRGGKGLTSLVTKSRLASQVRHTRLFEDVTPGLLGCCQIMRPNAVCSKANVSVTEVDLKEYSSHAYT